MLTSAQRTENEEQTFIAFVDSIVVKQLLRKLSPLRKLVCLVKPAGKFSSDLLKYVHNNSSLKLDKAQLEAMPLGSKFCCPGNKSKRLDVKVGFGISGSGQFSDICLAAQICIMRFFPRLSLWVR